MGNAMMPKIVRNISCLLLVVITLLYGTQAKAKDQSSFQADKDNVYALVKSGKGVQASKYIEKSISIENNHELKIERISLLVDLCLMTKDLECLARYINNYSDFIWDDLQKYFTDEAIQKDEDKDSAAAASNKIGDYKYNRASSQHAAIDFYFSDMGNAYASKTYNQSTAGHDKSKYAAFDMSTKAKRNWVNFDGLVALQKMRMARALIVESDINDVITQWHFADILSASLFLNDNDDIKYWIEIRKFYLQNNKKDIADKFNPYALLEINRLAIESGHLNDKELIQVRNEIDEIYKKIEIPSASSVMYEEKANFYADSFISNIIIRDKYIDVNDRSLLLSFPESLNAVGVIALNDAVNNNPDTSSKKRLEKIINEFRALVNGLKKDTFVYYDQLRALYLLEAVMCRYNNSNECEINKLELAAKASLDSAKNIIPGSLFQQPTLPRTSRILNAYIIKRLKSIGYASPIIDEFTLKHANLIYSIKNNEIVISRKLISLFNSEIEVNEAGKQYLVLRASYKDKLFSSYSVFLGQLINQNVADKTFLSRNATGALLTVIEEVETHWLKKYATNNVNEINIKNIQGQLSIDEAVLLSSVADGLRLTVLVSKSDVKTQITKSDSKSISDVSSLISTGNIHKITINDLGVMLDNFSNEILGDIDLSVYKRIYLLTGSSFAGVPYTLLRVKSQGKSKYLMEQSSVFAFDAYDEFNLFHSKATYKDNSQRRLSYLAFANPVFASMKDNKSYQLVIRGGGAGTVSNLDMLPETELEVKKFSENISGISKFYFGSEANVNNFFVQNYDSVEILSIATHGVMTGEVSEAMSPSFVLTPGDTNGLVDVNAIFNMYGSPRLVFLSTCNSATPDVNILQSQVASLANAFQLKGSESVVASLWQVNSNATQVLMSKVSKYLGEGYSSAESLRLAQKDMMNSTYSHPSMWAAFVVSGNYKPRKPSVNVSNNQGYDQMISGSLASHTSVDNNAYISVVDANNKDSGIYKYNAINKKYEITKKGMFHIDSINNIVYYVEQKSDSLAIGTIQSNQIIENCTISQGKWLPEQIMVQHDIAYFLYRLNDKPEVKIDIYGFSVKDCSFIGSGNYVFNTRSENQSVNFLRSTNNDDVHLITDFSIKDSDPINIKSGQIAFDKTCEFNQAVNLGVYSKSLSPKSIYMLPGYTYPSTEIEDINDVTIIRVGTCETNYPEKYPQAYKANINRFLSISKNSTDTKSIYQDVINFANVSKPYNISPLPPFFIVPLSISESDNGDRLVFGFSNLYSALRSGRSAETSSFFYSNISKEWSKLDNDICQFPQLISVPSSSVILCHTKDATYFVSH